MSGREPPMGRRNFLTLLGSFYAVGIGSALPVPELSAPAPKEKISTNTRTRADAVLSATGDPEIIEDLEMRMRLQESLHSAAEFATLAQFLDTDHLGVNEKGEKIIRLIYPAAGSHIAPLYTLAALIDEGRVGAAELTYTEIDECKQPELIQNLSNLPKVDSNFTFDAGEVTFEVSGPNLDQIEYHFVLRYKGKPITIHFCLNCSGKDYYRKEDFDPSDVYLLHDRRGHEPAEVLYLVSEYFRFQNPSNAIPPPIVMEDTTRYFQEGVTERGFDLELLGEFHRGKHAYGHRKEEVIQLDQFSPIQACRTWEDRRRVDSFSKADVEQWERDGKAPEQYMQLETETGSTYYENGVVLRPHAEILALDPKLTALLIDIGIAANELEYFLSKEIRRVNHAFYQGKAPLLFSSSFLGDLFDNANKIFLAFRTLNPKLIQGLAIRIIQILVKIKPYLIAMYIDENYPKDPEMGFQKILELFASMKENLMGEIKNNEVLAQNISIVEKYINSQETSYSFWRERTDALSRQGSVGDILIAWENSLNDDVDARMKTHRELYEFGNKLFEAINPVKNNSVLP